MVEPSDFRLQLIKAGVKQLQDFGYVHCNEDLILTDMVYKAFFVKLLRNSKTRCFSGVNEVIDQLLNECNA